MHSYQTYCIVWILSVVLKRTAKVCRITSLQDVFFWFDFTFMIIQYLIFCTTFLKSAQKSTCSSLCTAHLQVKSFKYEMLVIHWLSFFGLYSKYLFSTAVPDLRIHFLEHRLSYLCTFASRQTAFVEKMPVEETQIQSQLCAWVVLIFFSSNFILCYMERRNVIWGRCTGICEARSTSSQIKTYLCKGHHGHTASRVYS